MAYGPPEELTTTTPNSDVTRKPDSSDYLVKGLQHPADIQTVFDRTRLPPHAEKMKSQIGSWFRRVSAVRAGKVGIEELTDDDLAMLPQVDVRTYYQEAKTFNRLGGVSWIPKELDEVPEYLGDLALEVDNGVEFAAMIDAAEDNTVEVAAGILGSGEGNPLYIIQRYGDEVVVHQVLPEVPIYTSVRSAIRAAVDGNYNQFNTYAGNFYFSRESGTIIRQGEGSDFHYVLSSLHGTLYAIGAPNAVINGPMGLYTETSDLSNAPLTFNKATGWGDPI